MPMPGQITPPTYSPLRVTTSKVVAVPKSTTITGPAVGGEGGDAVDDAVGADVAGRLVEDRHARLDAGADHQRLVARGTAARARRAPASAAAPRWRAPRPRCAEGSRPEPENRLRTRMPYSSAVCSRRVVSRQCTSSCGPSNTPSTVFVLPTSIVRSMPTAITPRAAGAGPRPRGRAACAPSGRRRPAARPPRPRRAAARESTPLARPDLDRLAPPRRRRARARRRPLRRCEAASGIVPDGAATRSTAARDLRQLAARAPLGERDGRCRAAPPGSAGATCATLTPMPRATHSTPPAPDALSARMPASLRPDTSTSFGHFSSAATPSSRGRLGDRDTRGQRQQGHGREARAQQHRDVQAARAARPSCGPRARGRRPARRRARRVHSGAPVAGQRLHAVARRADRRRATRARRQRRPALPQRAERAPRAAALRPRAGPRRELDLEHLEGVVGEPLARPRAPRLRRARPLARSAIARPSRAAVAGLTATRRRARCRPTVAPAALFARRTASRKAQAASNGAAPCSSAPAPRPEPRAPLTWATGRGGCCAAPVASAKPQDQTSSVT